MSERLKCPLSDAASHRSPSLVAVRGQDRLYAMRLRHATTCGRWLPRVTTDWASGTPGGRAPVAARSLRWYVARIVRDRQVAALVLLGICATPIVSGCGSASQQTAGEPKTTFTMQVLRARFPAKQSIARRTALELTVRNASSKTAPNVAVTLDSLQYSESYPELSASKRPVWVVERGPGAIAKPPVQTEEVASPGGGETAYVSTWALGPLAPRAIATFRWILAPVKSGLHVVHYTVAAGLGGNAKAALRSGAPVRGRFVSYITPAPPPRHVNPNTGQVQPGEYPTAAGAAP
jgi:hypothetical protein